tara:strand:+ start:21662 stop:22060 length:399 start_codon:yes stop_codon:yes gene_type:complete
LAASCAAFLLCSGAALAQGGFKITVEVEPLPGPVAAPDAVFGPATLSDLTDAMQRCWAPPIDMLDSGVTSVVLVELNPDGSVAATTIVGDEQPALDKAAIDAVERCGPYTMMPREAHDSWRQIEVTFDTRDI